MDGLLSLWVRTAGFWLALAGATSIAALSASPAAATFPGATGKLAWADDGEEIITRDFFDADDVERSLGPGGAPRWSPDGTRIAFHGTESPGGIYVMNADGSDRRRLTSPKYSEELPSEGDADPTWSADGERIAYTRYRSEPVGEFDSDYYSQLRIVNTRTGSDTVVATFGKGVSNEDLHHSPDWSPDDSLIAVRLSDPGGFLNNRLLLVTPGGAIKATIPRGSMFWHSWSPKGDAIAVANMAVDNSPRVIDLYSPAGAKTGAIALPSGRHMPFDGGVRFTPDGAYVIAPTCGAGGDCDTRKLRVHNPDLDFHPDDPVERVLPDFPAHTGASFGIGDFQPQRQPVIFVHGFMGSTITCGAYEHWFPDPTRFASSMLKMRLGPDGIAPHPRGCAAEPQRILDKVRTGMSAIPIKNIYGTTVDFFEQMTEETGVPHHLFVWDWRKDPRAQKIALNTLIRDALEEPTQKAQGVRKVTLAGHSMGGLVIRGFIGEPTLAKRVKRVVTMATPYWGAPKALFPLAAGIEAPEDPLEVISRGSLREFARNLTGLYFLYPSERYRPWLRVDGIKPSPFNRAALENYVENTLGGNRTLLAKALGAHAAELDGFTHKYEDIDYRVVVGTGISTVGAINLYPGEGAAEIGWVNGDATVPGTSAVQGPLETATVDGVPISYVCGFDHVPLPGEDVVTGAIRDFLAYGTPPLKRRHVCENKSKQFRFNGIKLVGAEGAGAAAKGALTLAEAEATGKLQVLNFADEPIVVTDDDTPVSVVIKAKKARVEVRPITGEQTGKPRFYGPISGKLGVETTDAGAVKVFDDGKVVKPRSKPKKGDPVSGKAPPNTKCVKAKRTLKKAKKTLKKATKALKKAKGKKAVKKAKTKVKKAKTKVKKAKAKKKKACRG